MPKFYIPQIDGLRTLAFLLVFLHHFGPVESDSLYNGLVKWGWVGLDLFFVISGFLITSILVREKTEKGTISLKQFLVRRILRIWPLYYTAIFLGFFAFPILGMFGIKFLSDKWFSMFNDYFLTFLFFLGNFSFAYNIGVVSPMFSICWSIAVEEQFYFIWGYVFSYLKTNLNKALIITWLFSICCRAVIFYYSTTYTSYYYFTFSHFDPIVFGCLIGLNFEKLKNINPNLSFAIFFSSIAIFLLIWFSPDLEQNSFSNNLVFIYSALSMGLLCISVLTNPFLSSFFAWKPLIYFAKYTYGMYVFHYFGIYLSMKILGSTYFSFSRLILALGLTHLLGLLSWHFVEKPLIYIKKLKFSAIQTGIS